MCLAGYGLHRHETCTIIYTKDVREAQKIKNRGFKATGRSKGNL